MKLQPNAARLFVLPAAFDGVFRLPHVQFFSLYAGTSFMAVERADVQHTHLLSHCCVACGRFACLILVPQVDSQPCFCCHILQLDVFSYWNTSTVHFV